MIQLGDFVIIKQDVDICYTHYSKGVVYKVEQVRGSNAVLRDPVSDTAGDLIKNQHIKPITQVTLEAAVERKEAALRSDMESMKKIKQFLTQETDNEIAGEIKDFIEIEEATTNEDIMKLISRSFNEERLLGLIGSLHHNVLEFE